MNNLNELKQSLPDYAKDIKINLSNILAEENCRPHKVSNSNCLFRWKVNWPLDHHNDPKENIFVAPS